MLSDALRFIRTNFQICIIGLIISISTTVAVAHLKGIVTALINLCSYFFLLNFLISSCEMIKKQDRARSIKETFFRFDRETRDAIIKVFILALLLGCVVFIVTAPVTFISMTPFEAEVKTFMSQNSAISTLLTDLSFVISACYSVFFTISIASTIYFRADAFESIKNGFKTTVKLKVLLLITLLVSAIGFVQFSEEYQQIIYYFEKGIDTILNAVISFVSFFYFKGLEQVSSDKAA